MHRNSSLRLGTVLLATASSLSLATPALADSVLFSTSGETAAKVGERTSQAKGLTQIRLDSGATASFVDAADYRINADGSIDLYGGGVTVAGGGSGVVVRMPQGVEGRVGSGAAASFSVGADGRGRGHALTGSVSLTGNGGARTFGEGEMFAFEPGTRARQVVSTGVQATPGGDGDTPVVAMGDDAGPVAAARNGFPVTLGAALASAGASSDIVGAARRVEAATANPSIETFPAGDLQLLVAAAAKLDGAYGGTPFPGAQADIIRTYLGYLASGGSGVNFLTAYAGFLTQYLDLVRSGAAPSSFQLASLDEIDSFIAYTDRTGGFGSLSAQNRALVNAYLAFIQDGGNPDAFASSFTGLTTAYFAFIRAGGDPEDFSQASQATIDAYVAFLSDSGLIEQLSASDRALVAAYLQNGGLAFAIQYRAALDAYFAYLAGGGRPSDYAALDQATLKAYLSTLQSTGLLQSVLGNRASFYADYLAYLQAGGQPDAYAGLNVNIFAGYAQALGAYYDYLAHGGVPSGYTALTQEQIQAYLAELANAGASETFLDDLADFYSGYFTYLAGGGNPDTYVDLPVPPDYPAFAAALNAYAQFLANGGLPADYAAVDPATLQNYLDALANSGQLASLLGGNADLLTGYFAYIASGGVPNRYPGLPIYATYVGALNAYYAYLAGGGLPGDYTVLTPAQIRAYLDALNQAGGLVAYGDLDGFFAGYYAFLANGGSPANYGGIPIYADYLAALQAYYEFLAAGGLPSQYTALSQGQIEAYILALQGAGVLQAALSADELQFVLDYLAYLQTNADPDQFAGLPGNGPGNPDPTRTVLLGQQLAVANRDIGDDAVPNGSVTIDGQGRIVAYQTRANESFDVGTASIVESGQSGSVRWTRWASGKPAGNYYGTTDFGTVGANGGWHMIAGTAPTDLPTSGTLQYELTGATTPTRTDQSTATGSVAGGAAVLFGSTPRFGLDLDVTSGPDTINLATNGGLTDVSQSRLTIGTDGVFNSGALNPEIITTQLSGTYCASGCTSFVQGFLSGAQAEDIGLSYAIRTEGGAPQIFINGVAGFTAVAGGNNGGGSPASSDGVAATGAAGNYFTFIGAGGSGSATADAMTMTGDKLISATSSRDSVEYTSNANTTEQKGGDQGVIGWSRFGNVTTAYRTSTGQSFQASPYASQFWHNAWGAPAINLPASGLVNYELIGATGATQTNAQPGEGTFSGDFSVDFATLKAGLEAQVALNGETYSFASSGGVAAPSMGLFDDGRGARRFSENLQTTTSSGGSVTRGTFVQGFLAGDGATHAGLTYAVKVSSSNAIQGAAAFRAVSQSGGTGGSGGGTPPTSNFTGTRNGQVYYTFTNGSLASGFGGSADLVDGKLTNFTSLLGTVSSGTASIVEAGDLGDFAWARWTGGDVVTNSVLGNSVTAIGANGGYHVMAGVPSVTLPTAGKVDYTLISTTAATDNQGSAPGTIGGQLAIQFGTVSRVGYDMQMEVGGRGWAVHTNGGAADPSQSQFNLTLGSGGWTFGGTFTSTSGTVTGTGGACQGTCLVNISGAMFGTNGAYAGVAMNVTDASVQNGTIGASGLAIFSADPNAGATTVAPMAAPALAAAPRTYPVAVGALGDGWGRWTTGAPGIGTNGDARAQQPSAPGVAVAPSWITFAASSEAAR